jgi:3-oxoacyl-[acyl-carrier protein] reductase
MGAQNKCLDGKVAIVTGAGAIGDHLSIGRAEALRLAQEGAAVVVNNRHQGPAVTSSTAENVAVQIRAAGGKAIANTDSVSTFAGGRRIVEAAMDHFGRIDIVVNNAGFVLPNLIWDMSEEDFDNTVSVHLKGAFNLVRNAAPHLIRQRSGVVVNTGSHSGQGQYGNSAYAAAKEGVVAFTRSIARDLGPYNVRCNSIRPLADSKMGSEPDSKFPALIEAAEIEHQFPSIGDIWFTKFTETDLSPMHVANFVAWLCTDASADFNGMDFEICGPRIGVLAAPRAQRSVLRPGGWTLDDLNDPATRGFLIGCESNRFLPK